MGNFADKLRCRMKEEYPAPMSQSAHARRCRWQWLRYRKWAGNKSNTIDHHAIMAIDGFKASVEGRNEAGFDPRLASSLNLEKRVAYRPCEKVLKNPGIMWS